ncbi:hypothetical protein BK022_00200 [Methylorubrum extorquens]|uniref:Uncharacterized protein n=1 Tax=Methylorubrum extorquens TaxID=408 RepID=A0A1S1PBH6_METEX|nr:hypothetical protein BK022_00200 [Methylorubrum extorquens]
MFNFAFNDTETQQTTIRQLQERHLALLPESKRTRFTEPHEENGVVSHGVWFYPQDHDPRLPVDATGSSRRARRIRAELAQRTATIVESMVLTLRPDLVHHPKFEETVAAQGDFIFEPERASKVAEWPVLTIYKGLVARTIALLELESGL